MVFAEGAITPKGSFFQMTQSNTTAMQIPASPPIGTATMVISEMMLAPCGLLDLRERGEGLLLPVALGIGSGGLGGKAGECLRGFTPELGSLSSFGIAWPEVMEESGFTA